MCIVSYLNIGFCTVTTSSDEVMDGRAANSLPTHPEFKKQFWYFCRKNVSQS